MPKPILDHVVKLLLIGDSGTGKTSLLLQFTDNKFDQNTLATIGVDFRVKIMTIEDPTADYSNSNDKNTNTKTIKATVWDTAGQERYRTLTSSYYKGAHGIILVYDVNRRDTFDGLKLWLEEVDQYTAGASLNDVIKVLAGNKIDIKKDQVTLEEAEKFASENGMLSFRTSAKTKEGIDNVFTELLNKIIESPTLLRNTLPQKHHDLLDDIEKKSSCC